MEFTSLGPCGGTGGYPFDDHDLLASGRLRALRIWADTGLDAIQAVYSDEAIETAGPVHGTAIGSPTTVRFDPAEDLISLFGHHSAYIETLSLRTSQGHERRFGTPVHGPVFRLDAPRGYVIAGLWGRAGRLVDALGVHLVAKPTPHTIAPENESP